MSFTKADIRAGVRGNLGDPGGLTDQDIDQHIGEAIFAYSKLVPNYKVTDLTGDGSAYDFSLPSDFQLGFSSIVSIEFPANEQVPTYLADTSWILYQNTTTTKFRFLLTPGNGEIARIAYTVPHSIDADDASLTTVIDADRVAIEYLTTARAAEELAAEATRLSVGTNSDIPFLPAPVASYRLLAQDYLRMYYEHMDIPADGGSPGLSLTGSLSNIPSWGSRGLVREQPNPLPFN